MPIAPILATYLIETSLPVEQAAEVIAGVRHEVNLEDEKYGIGRVAWGNCELSAQNFYRLMEIKCCRNSNRVLN